MKTLGEIISLRKNKYKAHMKNPSFADFFQGYHAGWSEAYRDLEEILEQNGFNLNVPVIGVWKTNADHIRAMSDKELEKFIPNWSYTDACKCGEHYVDCNNECEKCVAEWLRQLYKEDNT